MVDDKDSKISKVGKTEKVDSVKEVGEVSEVSKVKKVQATKAVEGIRQLGRIENGSRIMSRTERDKMLGIVAEEAEAMLKNSGLSKKKQQIIQDAVKYAIDAGIIVDEDLQEAFDKK